MKKFLFLVLCCFLFSCGEPSLIKINSVSKEKTVVIYDLFNPTLKMIKDAIIDIEKEYGNVEGLITDVDGGALRIAHVRFLVTIREELELKKARVK